MENTLDFDSELWELAAAVEAGARMRFDEIAMVAEQNTQRVLAAFRSERVSDSHFAGTSGYGYNDSGRETLDRVYARVFAAEAAIVRVSIANGTHAIAAALYAALSPGDVLLSATGEPYDTLRSTIGIGEAEAKHGSLAHYGVKYREVGITPEGVPDFDGIHEAILRSNGAVRAVFVQRSRGYSTRRALSMREIARIARIAHDIDESIAVIVDNCYGEFTEPLEPCAVGADLIAGSLIKNPGGGLAPAGGYIAGRSGLVERAAERLTVPGVGSEVGATLGQNRLLFQGLFMAPHTVGQALRAMVLCAGMLEELGYETSPGALDNRSDIIQMVRLGSLDAMRRFCQGIQSGSPIDSFVTPEPWLMPGYSDPVIMAAGTFVQGSSIELSADGRAVAPYDVYLQGGLSYESAKIGVLSAISSLRR